MPSLHSAAAALLLAGVALCESIPPPVGAHYTRTLALPVLGQQTVELSILSSTVARLCMKGAISLDEPVKYYPSPDGGLGFALSDATQALLKRLRTSLRSAGYVAHEDSAWVTVAPGPLPAIKIKLDRTGGAQPPGLRGDFTDFILE